MRALIDVAREVEAASRPRTRAKAMARTPR
jgi:hypothetical protein